jgi:HPt (histidine-containing phosphotransfer) domain-containing protein
MADVDDAVDAVQAGDAALDGFAAELRALRDAYGRGLPGKVDDVAQVLAALRASGGDPAARESARSLAHRLGGTAGSYGFVAVGEAASVIEGLLTAPELDHGAIEGALAGLRLAATA